MSLFTLLVVLGITYIIRYTKEEILFVTLGVELVLAYIAACVWRQVTCS